jgi:hypothetical protein
VCIDDYEDAPIGHVLTTGDATKKKGKSHRTQGFNDDEDKCLCDAWLATSHDCINGAQQKGMVYWAKVMHEYNERKLHAPYEMLPSHGRDHQKKMELHQTRDKQVLLCR